MATWLKQSTAVEIKLGPFVDNVDGFTPETLLTIAQADVRLAKNGGDWAQKTEATSLVHEENGWYRCLLDVTDTGTLGILIVAVNETGALAVWREFLVVAANVYDSLLGGGDNLQVDAIQVGGTTQTAGDIIGDTNDIQARLPAALTIDGNIKADTLRVSGTLQTAGDITAVVNAIKAKTDQLVFTIANKVDSSIQLAGDFAQAAADKVWLTAARTLTAFGFSVTVGTNNDKTGYAVTVAEHANIADKLLGRAIAGAADGGRTVRQALRMLRNRRAIAAGTLSVYQEDDLTPDWTAAVTTAAGNPVDSIDPA